MRRTIAIGLALALLFARPGMTDDDHLVSPDRVAADLAASARARTSDLGDVDTLLARPDVERAAARIGLDVGRVRTVVPLLSDAELHDLAARAQALHTDPVAGDETMTTGIAESTSMAVLVLLLFLALLAGLVLGIKALVD